MQQFQARQIVASIVLLIISCLILNSIGLHSARAAQFADDWKKDWEKTVEAAKKEGQVSVYMGGWGVLLDSGEFQKAYPQIKVIGVTGRGGEIAKRILAERRAGKFLADVSSEGVGSNFRILHAAKSFDSIKAALILPEVLDESKWWQGKHRYVDPEGQYVFRYVGVPQFGNISFNTKLVDPAEFKSYWDLLNPKWKGKIALRDIRDPGPGNAPMRFFYHHPDIGPTFIKRLVGEMDVTLFRDFRQGVDWLANGKFSLCFFCADIDPARAHGLPVNELGMLKEGGALLTQYGTLSLLNKAPNPNAAKVFINWFLSRAGQMALQKSLAKVKIEEPDSLRIDIPKDDIPPIGRRADGVSYLDLDSRPEWIDMKPIINVFEAALEKRP